MLDRRHAIGRRREDLFAARLIHFIGLVKKVAVVLIAAFPTGVALIITAKGAWKDIVKALIN